MLLYFVILKNGVYLPDSLTTSLSDAKILFRSLSNANKAVNFELFSLVVKPCFICSSLD